MGWGRFSPPITIFYWPEVTLKAWAKSEMIEFLPNLGCPPIFLLEIEFWLRGVGEIFTIITIFYCPEVTLKVWAKSKLVEFLPNLGCPPPFFCLKSSFSLGGGDFHLQSQSFIRLKLPWKFEPNLSWFCIFWGAPPFFARNWVVA